MPENKRAILTDLDKLDAHEIQPEEYEDIPELTDEWFDKAEFAVGGKVVRPAKRLGRPKSDAAKKLIALRLDPDVIERFRATGPGWQSRINMVLREYLEKT
jgi:uncharacterized protein (DUF4415 family)